MNSSTTTFEKYHLLNASKFTFFWVTDSFFTGHGGWSEWSEWLVPDKPCGLAKSQRLRRCDNPAPKYRGNMCDPSQTNETRWINETVCPRKLKTGSCLFIGMNKYYLLYVWLNFQEKWKTETQF